MNKITDTRNRMCCSLLVRNADSNRKTKNNTELTAKNQNKPRRNKITYAL